jgi:hypothetical protein
VNADGTAERAALVKETSQQYSALRWDTTTLGSHVVAVQRSYGAFISVPLGASYAWTSDGHLVPSGTLSNTSSPTTPVGNPDGGSTFTIWQPSTLELFPEPGSPYIYSSYTAFLAWSPDGRYLIDSFSLHAIVHPAGEPVPTAAELNQLLGQQSAPTMPIHDPAQQRLYAALTSISNSGNAVFNDNIAWSPSGHILAAIPYEISTNPTSGSPYSAPVTFYDSATGKTVGTLQPASKSHISVTGGAASPYLNSDSLLRWSASGAHLLAYSAQLNTISIWGPSRLPRSALV